ncbi:DUF1904 family protein [Aneurinibacillus sp. BA2021]|nr:DUF1904 family protein [Aneurinibacillus sp. BA2021]
MPILRFKGVGKQPLQDMAPTLIKEVARIIEIPEDIVKIELLPIEQITDTPPILEILMFQREKEKHDALAASLYQILRQYGYDTIHIFYIPLTHSLYYKEGKPLSGIPGNARMTTYMYP